MTLSKMFISLVFLLALTQGGLAAERQLRWKRGSQMKAVVKRRELKMRRLASQNAPSEQYYDNYSFDVGQLEDAAFGSGSASSKGSASGSGLGSFFRSCGKGGKGGKGGSGSFSGSASGKGKGGSGSLSGSASRSKGSGSRASASGSGGKGKAGGSASGPGRRRDLGSGSGSGKGGGSRYELCEEELPDDPAPESPEPFELPEIVVSPITIVEEQEHLIEEQQDFINSIIAQRRNFSPSNDDPESNDADSPDDRKK